MPNDTNAHQILASNLLHKITLNFSLCLFAVHMNYFTEVFYLHTENSVLTLQEILVFFSLTNFKSSIVMCKREKVTQLCCYNGIKFSAFYSTFLIKSWQIY